MATAVWPNDVAAALTGAHYAGLSVAVCGPAADDVMRALGAESLTVPVSVAGLRMTVSLELFCNPRPAVGLAAVEARARAARQVPDEFMLGVAAVYDDADAPRRAIETLCALPAVHRGSFVVTVPRGGAPDRAAVLREMCQRGFHDVQLYE